MSEPYRHKPQYEQVKFLAKNSCQTPLSGATLTRGDGSNNGVNSTRKSSGISPALAAALSPGMSSSSNTKDGKTIGQGLQGLQGFDIFSPTNILILTGIIIFLLLLLFLGQRNVKRRWSSTIETVAQNLKQLSQQQQVYQSDSCL